MAITIIPATPHWTIAESVLSDEWTHLRFAYSPIIAWAISDDEVLPITLYGRPEVEEFFVKDPDGGYWSHDWGMDEAEATEVAGRWARRRKEEFDSTSKKTVAQG